MRTYITLFMMSLGIGTTLVSVPPKDQTKNPILNPNQVKNYIAWTTTIHGADLTSEGRAQWRDFAQQFFYPGSTREYPVFKNHLDLVLSNKKSRMHHEWVSGETIRGITYETGLNTFQEFYKLNLQDQNWNHYRRHFSMLWPKVCDRFYRKISSCEYADIMDQMRKSIYSVRRMRDRCQRNLAYVHKVHAHETRCSQIRREAFEDEPRKPKNQHKSSPNDVRSIAEASGKRPIFTNTDQGWQEIASPQPIRRIAATALRTMRRSNTHVNLSGYQSEQH